MTNDVATQEQQAPVEQPRAAAPTPNEEVGDGTLARIILKGDLSSLNARELVTYYYSMCRTIGADPLTRPFDLIEMPDEKDKTKTRLILYPNARCASQLRANHKINFEEPKIEEKHGCVVVTIRATMNGRADFDTGAVPTMKAGGEWVDSGKKWPDGKPKQVFRADGTMEPLDPLAIANAIKKAITQAKRRVTFSLCGLAGLPDQDDADNGTFQGAKTIDADTLLETGALKAVAAPTETANGGAEKAAPSISVAVKKFVAARDDLANALETKAAGTKLDAEARKKLGEDWTVKTVGPETAAAIREALAKSETGYVDAEIYRVAAAMQGESMRIRNGTGSAPAPESKQKTLI